MRTSTTLKLLALVLLAAAFVWLVDRRLDSTDASSARERRLLHVVPERVTFLAVARQDAVIECEKRGRRWYIVKPFASPAGAAQIHRMLHLIESLPRFDVITAAEREARGLTLEHFSLSEPRVRVAFGDDRNRLVLLVGCDAPLSDHVYVKLAASDEILATSRQILDLVPSGVDDLRARELLYGEPSAVSRIDIERPGHTFMRLVREKGGWAIEQPVRARADDAKVNRLLKGIFSVRVSQFVYPTAQRAASRPDPVTYGLAPDEARMQISLTSSVDGSVQKVMVGKQAAESESMVYARVIDREDICTVEGAAFRAADCGVDDLRERRVFAFAPHNVGVVAFREGERRIAFGRDPAGAWNITEPRRWPADPEVMAGLVAGLLSFRVTAFAGDESRTNLAAWGLLPTRRSVLVAPAPPAVQDAPRGGASVAGEPQEAADALVIGRPVDLRRAVYAKFERQPSAFEIADHPVLDLFAARYEAPDGFGGAGQETPEQPQPAVPRWLDPLTYRDRSVLRMPPGSVCRISRQKGRDEQTVECGRGQPWRALRPAGASVESNAVAAVTLIAERLRAVRMVHAENVNLAPFGLGDSATRLTLGTAGAEGGQKTVLFGFKVGTDGVYAMLQGLDVIFVLSGRTVDVLLSDLVRPPVEAGGASRAQPPR